MTPITAPVSTPTRSTAEGRADAVVPTQPVTMVVSAVAAAGSKPTDAGQSLAMQVPAGMTEVACASFATSHWPNLNADKPNPGSDDWRVLQGRAFSLRLRGPHGQIGA